MPVWCRGLVKLAARTQGGGGWTHMPLVRPHGPERRLLPRLVESGARTDRRAYAETLPRITMSSLESADLLMMGTGAFTPLSGFMRRDDWERVLAEMSTADGVFWPIPITLSVDPVEAAGMRPGTDRALVDEESRDLLGILTVEETYTIDRRRECEKVFHTTDEAHPGVARVMAASATKVAGPVEVLSEGACRAQYPGLCLRPDETRAEFAARGWERVAAFQTRNPMHRSHEYLAKLALEVSDGLFIHQVLGRLKPGDIPAPVRVAAIAAVVEHYFVPGTVVVGGYPLDMRYAGPREALLHAVFRQNFGCSHLIIGRDHAGVGSYYGPFDAQKIFREIPADALEIQPLRVGETFYCQVCDGMATTRTCPHGAAERITISGTRLREMLRRDEAVPEHFSRPEVLALLREYYRQT